jgi:membrane protease subunit (stomatin/prohibitin family)
MEVLLETTEWADNTPNHTYVLDDAGKLVGYRKSTGEIQVFTKPMRFDKRLRKFKKVVDKELLDAILYITVKQLRAEK